MKRFLPSIDTIATWSIAMLVALVLMPLMFGCVDEPEDTCTGIIQNPDGTLRQCDTETDDTTQSIDILFSPSNFAYIQQQVAAQ